MNTATLKRIPAHVRKKGYSIARGFAIFACGPERTSKTASKLLGIDAWGALPDYGYTHVTGNRIWYCRAVLVGNPDVYLDYTNL